MFHRESRIVGVEDPLSTTGSEVIETSQSISDQESDDSKLPDMYADRLDPAGRPFMAAYSVPMKFAQLTPSGRAN